MRIAHVCPYDWDVAGGVRQHVQNLARQHSLGGHEVTVFAPSSGRGASDPDITVVPGRVLGLPGARSVSRIAVSPSVWRHMRRVLAEGEYDVVHIHEPLTPLVSLAAVRWSDAVLVGTIHGYRPGYPPYRLFRRPLDRLMRRLSARIAVSVDARSWTGRYFPGDYEIIPDGVDVEQFRAASQRTPELLRHPGPTILFVGRLEPRKGLPILLEAMPTIRTAVPDVRLVVVGAFSHADRERLAADVGRLALDCVDLVGFVPDDDLPGYYGAATVFCAPSTGNEALGIVLLEAMAAGTPIVTTDIEGYRTVVRPDVEALVVPPSRAAPLAEALVRTLTDSGLRERLVAAGSLRVAEYDWPVLARRVTGLYETAVAKATSDATIPRIEGVPGVDP